MDREQRLAARVPEELDAGSIRVEHEPLPTRAIERDRKIVPAPPCVALIGTGQSTPSIAGKNISCAGESRVGTGRLVAL